MSLARAPNRASAEQPAEMLAGWNGSQPFHEDMIRIVDRLPTENEYRRVRHLALGPRVLSNSEPITDDQLHSVLRACPHLETIVLSGVPDTTDRTIVALAESAPDLQGINLTGCSQVTDVGVLELTAKSLPLQWIYLNGVVGLTDPAVSAIAKSCSRLVELDLSNLPLLSPLSVRDLWSYSRKLRTLRLARCPLLNNKAFPSSLTGSVSSVDEGDEKPLPPRPVTWVDQLPPLILHHTADSLRILDVSFCKITDDAIKGIVTHAPRLQNLNLSGCSSLTDEGVESISGLRDHLDVLLLAHVTNITDRAIVRIARDCNNLRCIDVAFCRNLTDMSVFELAGLDSLRRLSLVRVQKLTDIAVFALAEHAVKLERLYLSYCDHVSLDAIHLVLKKIQRLEHLACTGIPSLKRMGVHRFVDPLPPTVDEDQRSAFYVFSGERIGGLRKFLDKEEQRQREAEARNIPFVPRADDTLDLY